MENGEKKMKETFVETHAHLAHEFAYSELDKVAESGLFEKIWLHSIECVNSPRHSGNKAVLEVAGTIPACSSRLHSAVWMALPIRSPLSRTRDLQG